ncbi:MAG: FKBP-type peptidyl-prolyl cis-trans isomerase [Pseudomonadota bacterium]
MQFAHDHRTGRRAPLRAPFAAAAAAAVLALTAGCGGTGGNGGDGGNGGAEQAALEDDSAKASYSLGYRFAENVQSQFGDGISREAFVRGVNDRLTGEDARVSDQEAERVLMEMMQARQTEMANEAQANLEEGEAFLEENAQREDVVTLDSGLQYEVLEQGEGAQPEASDRVTTHYEGRLVDGTVFDSSYERGEPATFPLDRVIPGWTEGLQLMAPGAKYRLYVPAELAYGERGAGDSVPPNSVLIFDVELLDVESGDGAAASGEAQSGDGSGAAQGGDGA